jgi:hypothetical protein
MLVINRNSPQHLPALFLGAEPIEWADNVKDLGIYVDSRLNFSRHLSEVCHKLYAALHRHIRMKLCNSLFLPYGDIFCANLREQDARRLEVALNSCMAAWPPPIRPYPPYRRFSFKSFLQLRLHCKLIRTGCLSYLCSELVKGSPRTGNFVHTSESFREGVLVSGMRGWNTLPVDIKELRSTASFAGAVSKWLEERA